MAALEIKKYGILAAAAMFASLSAATVRKTKQIILFGSTALGTATPESDVDLFFDVAASSREIQKIKVEIRRAVEDFRLSQAALQFKMRGIENDISPIVGNLEEWPELHRSISASGIILYGKYTAAPKGKKSHLIISLERLDPQTKGAFLNKLYGYKVGKKRYRGLLYKAGGAKLGKGTIMVPIEQKPAFTEVLSKYKVEYKVLEVFM